MSYGYNVYDNTSFEYALSVLGSMLLGVLLFSAVIGLVFYIFRAIGTYQIARRRGINHPWLAWIPVANAWTLGCISDQYQYLVKGKNTKRRVTLLVLTLVSMVLSVVVWCAFLVPVFRAMLTAMASYGDPEAALSQIMGPIMMYSSVSYLISILSIVLAVFRFMALYDLYSSCIPGSNVLFLVLSIIFSFTEPFFIFACRDRDDGMPPRRVYP